MRKKSGKTPDNGETRDNEGRGERALHGGGRASIRDVEGGLPASSMIDARSIALAGLFGLALFYTLYFARSLIIPLVLAVLLSFVLAPVVRGLKRLSVPPPLGAALILIGLMGAVGYGSYRLARPAAQWMERAPQDLRQLESWLQELKKPMENVREATEQVEDMARVDGAEQREPVEVRGPSFGDSLFSSTVGAVGRLLMMVLILYLLLASDGLLVRKMVEAVPDRAAQRRVLRIARRTERRVSWYLFTVTCINAGLGLAVAAAMFLLGLPNPMLWGALAMVLNFVPYLGGTVMMLVLTVVAVATHDEPWRVLLAPAVFLVLNLTEAYLVTPLVLSRQFSLNVVVVFVGLLFWGWLWGPAGVLLAVPMLATLKILSDQIPLLSGVGSFLGR